MTRDPKPIIFGAIAFCVGQIISAYLISSAGQSSGGGALVNAVWLFTQLTGYFVAILAGALASYLATEHRILTGIGAVALGTITFALLGIISGRQSLSPVLLALVMFGFFAWLGAIIGAYAAKRRGT